jgi:carotenoid cleavage dioxygenase
LRSAQQVHIPGGLPNIHDFAVIDRHLVFLLSPMPINESKLRAGASFAQACEWRPELGTRVLVMDKADLRQRWYELPPFCVFHISNAWVRADDTIELEFVAARTPLSLMAGWSVMAGQYTHREGGLLFKLELRSDGTVGLEDFGGLEGEFPTIRASRVGRAHGQLLMPTRSSTRDRSVPGFDTLSLVDVTSGGVVSYSFGSDWQVEEHHFIGEHAVDGADDRWIIGTALNVRSALTALVVFDAADLAAGPVAKAWMDQAMPLGLHGTFVPRLCQK